MKNSELRYILGFPGCTVVKNPHANAGESKEVGLILRQKDTLEQKGVTHSRILTWKIPQTGNLEVYSPWDCKESDMTEHTQDILKTARLKVYPLSQE